MKLLSAAGRRALPALYAQEDLGDNAVAYVKFFFPASAATWYATEFDGDDTFFGLCDLGVGFPELGYFSLAELQSFRGPLGIGIERDLYWTPRPLRECKLAGVRR